MLVTSINLNLVGVGHVLVEQIMKLVLTVILVCLPDWAGAFQEANFLFSDIEGKLVTPDGRDEVTRAVLILHGWNDHMDGVGDLQADLAHELAGVGIASLRINFRGEGARNNNVITSTFQSRMEDAAAGYRFLEARFPAADYGIQGWSLGGLIAMSLAGRHPARFASMALWSSAETMGRNEDQAYLEAARLAMENGRAVYQAFVDITLTREFLASYMGVNTRNDLAAFRGSFLTIRGDKDYLPSHDRAWLELLATEDKSFLLIGGADHIFNVLTSGSRHRERVIAATRAWFLRTLPGLNRKKAPAAMPE